MKICLIDLKLILILIPVTVDIDKKKFSEMKNLDQSNEIANRKVSEILSRFDRKIKDPRSFAENKKLLKLSESF